MSQPTELTMEQQFSLASFNAQVSRMSHEQAKDFLMFLYQQMLVKETMYKHFLKHEWNLEGFPKIQ